MFWTLFLAHLLGDYPLQTDGLVRAKQSGYGLALHAAIHLALMLILVGTARTVAWPYLLALAAFHLILDRLKMRLGYWRPHWITVPYVVDQSLHLLAIALASSAIESRLSIIPASPLSWQLLASAYLLVTYVWFISERLCIVGNASYRRQLIAQAWPRMMARALFLTIFLWIGRGAWDSLAAGSLALPYRDPPYARRALVTDLVVSLTTALVAIALSR